MVEPKAPGNHVYSLVSLPRLGLPILGTLAKRRGLDVRVYVEEIMPVCIDELLRADLVCISTITSTAPRAYHLADKARAAGVPVVLGGPHVTFLAQEALEHADWVLKGEADQSFIKLLDMLEGHTGPEEVPGLSYWSDDEMVHNPLATDPVDMNEVPIPDFSLLAYKGKPYIGNRIIPLQTSRGCPHHCKFCSVTPMFGHKMRYASREHVAEELERWRGNGGDVFFYDDNFCASPSRTKGLLDYLLRKDVFLPHWMAQVSVRAAKDDEMLKLMQKAGCRTVFVGFESIDTKSLKLFHKRQTIEDIRMAIRKFHKHGIWVHGMFVTGSDADGVDTIRDTSRFAIQEDIDSIQFAVLTPLPGTVVYEEMKKQDRLITENWGLYDAHHSVFQPNKMSAYQLISETMKAMARVYSLPRIMSFLSRGKMRRAALSLYAHRQIKRWRRANRHMLREGAHEKLPIDWAPSGAG